MLRRTWVALVVVVLLLAACGGQTSPAGSSSGATSAGNAANGQKLFEQSTLGKASLPGCKTCHSIVKGQTLVGPSLAGIATDAAATIKESGYKGTAKTAEEWLNESIVNPNVDVPEGYTPNIMPQNFKEQLTSQEINDLVAYLLTLK